MSADAKVWLDGQWWKGIHDGECTAPVVNGHESLSLIAVLIELETCLGHDCQWKIRHYANGDEGLVAYRL